MNPYQLAESILSNTLKQDEPLSSERNSFREIDLYGHTVNSKKRDLDSEIFHLKNESGTGEITIYYIFPGIDVAYNDMHIGYCSNTSYSADDMIEINHCQEGRYECDFGSQTCCYMSPGDLTISMPHKDKTSSCFPLNHYHGISVFIDLSEIPAELMTILKLLSIDLGCITDLVCKRKRYFIVRADKSIEHIFSELYSVRDVRKPGYLKVKILELLMFLTDFKNWEPLNDRIYLNRNQVQTIKTVQAYIVGHLRQHVTIPELAQRFELSPTALKNGFKEVYGTSIYAWLRAYRLQTAQQLLKNSALSIAAVAAEIGYENPNKFSSAFKQEFHISPTEYRKGHA